MNKSLGFLAAAVALIAFGIFYRAPAPAPVVPVSTVAPVVVAEAEPPARVAAPIPIPAPVRKNERAMRNHERSSAQVSPTMSAGDPKGPHSLKIDCSRVPAAAQNYPRATVESYARSYGVPEVYVRQIHSCLTH